MWQVYKEIHLISISYIFQISYYPKLLLYCACPKLWPRSPTSYICGLKFEIRQEWGIYCQTVTVQLLLFPNNNIYVQGENALYNFVLLVLIKSKIKIKQNKQKTATEILILFPLPVCHQYYVLLDSVLNLHILDLWMWRIQILLIGQSVCPW